MYKEDSMFESPGNDNIKVWRYIDFTKFVSLLSKNSLYFRRLDLFEDKDPFEGSLPTKNVLGRDAYIKKFWKNIIGDRDIDDLISRNSKLNKSIRKSLFVNCWHINKTESEAMWKLYLKSDEGIAIQSTFAKLKKCFDAEQDYDIYIGKVKYIDHSSDRIPINNVFSPCLHKRESFKYERELRAVIWDIEAMKKSTGLSKDSNIQEGIYVNTNISVLIEKILLAPRTPLWFHDLVRDVADKYHAKLGELVETSVLNKLPVY